jgi:ABC-2 type transport system ATP-binding protein
MSTFLEIHNIRKYYGAKEALKGVTLSIRAGEIFGLLGVNGAGKTTLSNIIATLCPPSAGNVFFHGIPIYANIPSYRMHIGYCPQTNNLHRMLTLEDNLLQAGRYYGMNEADLKNRLEELSKQLSLHEYLKYKPDMLSGGFRQRFMIARSLMHKPSLVILDEPTVALDPHIRHQLWELIKMLKLQGISVLLTTHYLDEAEYLSDRVCVLHNGEVIVTDTPQNLKAQYTKGRLEEVFLQLIQEQSNAKKIC